jgi:tRNA threonylcarbamoyl adenosine modification protein YeaZ
MLAVGLEKDGVLIYKKEYDAFKKQSELLAKEIADCLKQTKIKSNEINKVVVTNGPGSYTGIRIGLTFAKVFAASLNIDLVLISSLHALAGKKDNVISLIDAKGKRAYYGIYNKGKVVKEDCVDYLENIDITNYELVGDTYLFNIEEKENSIIDNMFDIYKNIEKIEDPKFAKAIYLKDAI